MTEFKTSTLHQDGGTQTGHALGAVRLVVLEGPDRGRSVELSGGTFLVGTLPDCALALTDPTVSRRHATVEHLARRLRVKDLGSKNGTRFQGARIEGVELPVGSLFTVGNTTLGLLPAAADAESARTELAGLVGTSTPMRRLFAELERVGPSEAPVLIRGETGTGKGAVARALHALSERASGPLRIVDCGAVQRDLFPSALFGHVRGAFTGAVKDAPGALALADGGTLFLDEVAELPQELQPMLLRALETQTFTRVGESVTSKSDFRIVAATHVDLEEAAQKGAFRLDLFYRLAAIILHVPPLRERTEDIPLLVRHHAPKDFSLPPSLMAALCSSRWPGNVRELQNVVERAVTLGPEALLQGAGAEQDAADYHDARQQALRAFERTYLEELLQRHRGSVTAAAREAKVARSYFYRLVELHGLRPRKEG